MNKKIALLFVFLGFLLMTGCTPQETALQKNDNLNSGRKIPGDLQIPLPKEVPILMYHYIGDIPTDEKNVALRSDLTVSVANFEEQLKWLKANEYATVWLSEAAAFSNAKDGYWSPLSSFAWPQKPIILTFDDGYEDAYTNALPLLQKYGMYGSFAIITGKIGTPGYLTWEQVKQMQQANMEIVSHTVSHPDLSTDSVATVKSELEKSRADMEAHQIYSRNFLVYPSGKYNSSTIEQLKLAGYIGARTTKSGKVTKESDAYELPVIRIHGSTTIDQFHTIIGSEK